METTKLNVFRRLVYGICGICGPKVEASAAHNNYDPASRPSINTPPQTRKKRKKPPANVSLQGQAPVSPDLQSPRSVQQVLPNTPMGNFGGDYFHNPPTDVYLPDSGYPTLTPPAAASGGWPNPCGGNNFPSATAPPSGSAAGSVPYGTGYSTVPVDSGLHWGYSENPPYETDGSSWYFNHPPPTDNVGSPSWNHPHQATGVLGQIPWQSQPKDDGSMLRLFKNVDGRLTDHILNFYIASDGVPYQDDFDSDLSKENREFLDAIVPDWPHLLSKQESRISLLRAIIATKVLGNHAFQASSSHGNNHDLIYQIAKATCDLTSQFALNGSNYDARFRSMEALVSAAAELYSTISAQPTRFEVSWERPGPVDTKTMEAVLHSDQPSRNMVRATVFPGLLKRHDTNVSLLAKTQVLLY